MNEQRRDFLMVAGGLSLAAAAGARPAAAKSSGAKGTSKPEDDIAPPEDLMREHGVLNRILLVYEEGIRRIGAKQTSPMQTFPMETLAGAADLIRRFIEQYHERLEEDHLFPRFEKANRLVDLVGSLRRQHQAGRGLTETILKLATPAGGAQAAGDRQKLLDSLGAFIRMYRPHEAREDTVLFPALRSLVRPKEMAELGERFEDKEHELFGAEGFEGVVAQVAKLERAVGLYDLDQFTPRG